MDSVIDGVFNASGVPYVYASVLLPGLMPPDETPLPVPFLVDTGSGSTCLHPRVAQDLGIDLSLLEFTVSSTGIGGHTFSALADGTLLFYGDGFYFECRVPIRIFQPAAHNRGLPSLLGRDVLRQFNMRYEPANGILQFISNEHTTVVSA